MNIKIKKINPSYDLTGGMISHLRYLARVGLAYKDKDAGGKMLYLSERYVRSKMAPVPAGAWNAITGKNFMGEPTDFKTELLDLPKPIMLSNFYDAAKGEGSLGLFKVMPEFFGIGATRFKSANEYKQEIKNIRGNLGENPTRSKRIEAGRKIKLYGNLIKRGAKNERNNRGNSSPSFMLDYQ